MDALDDHIEYHNAYDLYMNFLGVKITLTLFFVLEKFQDFFPHPHRT